jgi:hypothetical protein
MEGAYLREVAELVGAPSGRDILANPLHWLAEYLSAEYTATSADPPSPAAVAGCQSRFWTEHGAIAYMEVERGLSEETLRRAGVGWDGDESAFVFPVYDRTGELVNRILRPWPHVLGPKYKAMPGRTRHNGGVQLYPHPMPDGLWLLVEGIVDALLLRQHGFPSVTSTHGVNTFLDEWLPLVKGRKVAVAYDVGVEEVQRQRVAQLRAAGADAWGIQLSSLGLPDKGDLSDYLSNGGTARKLRAFLNAEYRRTQR